MLAQTLKQKLFDIMPELLNNDERAMTSRVHHREKVTLKRVAYTAKPLHQRRVDREPLEEIESMLS